MPLLILPRRLAIEHSQTQLFHRPCRFIFHDALCSANVRSVVCAEKRGSVDCSVSAADESGFGNGAVRLHALSLRTFMFRSQPFFVSAVNDFDAGNPAIEPGTGFTTQPGVAALRRTPGQEIRSVRTPTGFHNSPSLNNTRHL